MIHMEIDHAKALDVLTAYNELDPKREMIAPYWRAAERYKMPRYGEHFADWINSPDWYTLAYALVCGAVALVGISCVGDACTVYIPESRADIERMKEERPSYHGGGNIQYSWRNPKLYSIDSIPKEPIWMA